MPPIGSMVNQGVFPPQNIFPNVNPMFENSIVQNQLINPGF